MRSREKLRVLHLFIQLRCRPPIEILKHFWRKWHAMTSTSWQVYYFTSFSKYTIRYQWIFSLNVRMQLNIKSRVQSHTWKILTLLMQQVDGDLMPHEACNVHIQSSYLSKNIFSLTHFNFDRRHKRHEAFLEMQTETARGLKWTPFTAVNFKVCQVRNVG